MQPHPRHPLAVTPTLGLLLILLAALGVVGLPGCGDRPQFIDRDGDMLADPEPSKLADPATLQFCYAPGNEAASSMSTVWTDFLAHVATVTGREVNFVEIAKPTDMRESMRNGSLHFGGFNTGAVPSAVEEAGFHPLFVMAGEDADGDGTPDFGYYMHIIVRRGIDGEIQDTEGLRGKKLALTHTGSNSGYKAPVVLLDQELNITIDADNPSASDVEVEMSGSHETSIIGVANGTYDAACVASDVLKQLINAGTIDESDVKILYTSPQAFPTTAFGYAHNLTPELKEKIRTAFLTYNDGSLAGTSLGEHFGLTTFHPIDYQTNWQLVRDIRDRFQEEEKKEEE